MESGTKKIIMIIVIVACLAAAGAITYLNHAKKEGVNAIEKGSAKIWLICRNPDCGNTWQMDKRAYFDYLESKKQEMGFTIPGVPCPKCGEESGYRAIKCPKCGAIFEKDSVPDGPSDKCPECGYSETEAKRKARGR